MKIFNSRLSPLFYLAIISALIFLIPFIYYIKREMPYIEKYSNGNKALEIIKGTKRVKTSFGEITITDCVTFYKNGKIKDAKLSEPQLINSQLGKLKASAINFHNNGCLETVSLSEPQNIKTPMGNFKPIYINFYPDGNIESLVLRKSKKIRIQYNTISPGTIRFDKDGNIKSIVIEGTATINEKQYRDGTIVELDKSGKIVHIEPATRVFGECFLPVEVRDVRKHQRPIDNND
jgi:hypothetical protein